MNRIQQLGKLIQISDNTQLQINIYGKVLGILACNRHIKELPPLEKILLESLADEEFPVVLNSVYEHLNAAFSIVDFNVEKRTIIQKLRESSVDPAKSRLAKMVWKKNKAKVQRGLGSFQKSSQGKAFNKALNKFVTSRSNKSEAIDPTDMDALILGLHELRISMSSALTQLLIDMKSSPENYEEFPAEDFDLLMDAYGEAMKDMQDAYISRDPVRIEDVMDEVIAEIASVLIGVDMDYIYNDLNEPK